MYGDAVAFTLPGTGIVLHLSSLYWQDALPYDPRDWTPPEIAAGLTVADYAAGRDPALEAILAGPPPPLREALLPAIDKDDADAVARDGAAWFALAAHRYADPWQALQNLAAYASGTSKRHAAIALLQLAVARHPERAFAHDDLGDALAEAGRRDEARAAYRAALARNPHDPRAAAALGLRRM
jgi:tetratricopeptide (TPR) repeat protein